MSQLTARGVKTILTRAGIDHSPLTITDDPAVWRDLGTGKRGTYVVITGPKERRTDAFWVLFERGLSVAPYSDRDEWCRK